MNHKEDSKFKANPYNFNNVFISEQQVINIMKSLNINDFQLTNLDFYKTAFIHKSYCNLKIMKNMIPPVETVYPFK